MNLGSSYIRQGKPELAEEEYLAAIRLSPRFVPARVNHADLYRATGREADGERLLRETIAQEPQASAAHHALGLALIRQKRYGEALDCLRRAWQLEPAYPRYAYVYATALQSMSKIDEARQVLITSLLSSPSNVDLIRALLQDALASGDLPAALKYAERLCQLLPADSDLASLTVELRLAAQLRK